MNHLKQLHKNSPFFPGAHFMIPVDQIFTNLCVKSDTIAVLKKSETFYCECDIWL